MTALFRNHSSELDLRDNIGDVMDVSSLFNLGDPNEQVPKMYRYDGRRFRCCCHKGKCTVADLSVKNSCDKSVSIHHRDSCPCALGSGYRSFHQDGGRFCLVPPASVAAVLKMTQEKLKETVAASATMRYIDGWHVTYGECSTLCGHGHRNMISSVCNRSEGCEQPVWTEDSIPCTTTDGCQWKCEHSDEHPCGFGKVSCSDGRGAPGQACGLKAEREAEFPDAVSFGQTCFRHCKPGQELSTLCAITSNHLDEQYGSVTALVAKTCLSDGSGHPTLPKPQLIVLLTQELNHAAYFTVMSSNDFPSYVSPDALPGYVRAATCEGDLSANTAVFVKKGHEHHVFTGNQECTGSSLRSDPCDYTNCKGSTVMGLTTSAGKLVIGNWHGARAGTLSNKRVGEFEQLVKATFKIQPFAGRKLVLSGGDSNVRSNFGPKRSLRLDASNERTPAEIRAAMGHDILGIAGWSVDQHLKGEVGLDKEVMSELRRSPLKQVKGWDTMCPTKTKTQLDARYEEERVWTGEYEWIWFGRRKKYRTVKKRIPNLRCRSPPDQMSTGESSEELLDMKRPSGDKSSSPSWTERLFLSPMLFESCGKAMKDIRNPRSDHDPFYTRCKLPALEA